MLLIELARIPPEGLEISEAVTPREIHVEAADSFVLLEGGRLECYPFALYQDLDLFYLPHGADEDEEEEDEVELADRDMVVAYHQGERLDLGEMIREQFFLAVPMKRLCREQCAGIC